MSFAVNLALVCTLRVGCRSYELAFVDGLFKNRAFCIFRHVEAESNILTARHFCQLAKKYLLHVSAGMASCLSIVSLVLLQSLPGAFEKPEFKTARSSCLELVHDADARCNSTAFSSNWKHVCDEGNGLRRVWYAATYETVLTKSAC